MEPIPMGSPVGVNECFLSSGTIMHMVMGWGSSQLLIHKAFMNWRGLGLSLENHIKGPQL